MPLSPALAVILGDLPLIQASFQLIFRSSFHEQLEFIITPNVFFKLLIVGFIVDSVILIIHEYISKRNENPDSETTFIINLT
jgi:hypothetical protein